MLYIDAPYGLGYEEWDKKAFDLQDYKSIFKQMEAITSMENWIAVVWTARDHGSIVVQAMLEQGFKATQEICWYKFNQNQEGTQNLVNSLEHCTIGFKEGRKSVPWFMSANPSERHNLAVGGTQRKLHMRVNGTPINAYQKPPYLARSIVKAWLPPGSTVIVGGVGAGGDVEGLISAGMNVVGFENDSEQTSPLVSVWNKYESDFKSNGKFGWAEQEPMGTFGGMHFEKASNLSNYKRFLETLIAEEEGLQEPSEEIPQAIPATQRILGPACGSCSSHENLDPQLNCSTCNMRVCTFCWADIVATFHLQADSPIACCEDHLPGRQVVLETQMTQTSAETFARSALC